MTLVMLTELDEVDQLMKSSDVDPTKAR